MSSRTVEIVANDDRATADVDVVNEALVMQDEIHANIHRGVMFSGSYFDLAIADDASIEILFQVDASQSAHLRFGGASGGDAELEIFEGTTFSAAGTAVPTNNRNRLSGNTASTVITHTPTLTGDGTSLMAMYVPGGTGFLFTQGGQSRSFEEWILVPGQDYLMRITNRSGVAQPLSALLDFYEPS